MKKIFISHPLTGDEEANKAKERIICQEVLEQGEGLPISPLSLFSFIEKEDPEQREEIMEVCKKLIDLSDEVWIYGSSPGCKEEEEYALAQGKKTERKG